MRRVLLVLVLLCLAVVVLPSIPTRAQSATTYVVQPGDNLFRISLRYGVTFAALAQANGIVNVNLIFVGQVLRISGAPVGPTPGPGQPTSQPPANLSGF